MTQPFKTMDKLAQAAPDKLAPVCVGKIIECRILSISKHKVIVDVAGIALGLVPEREFSYDVDDLSVGDKVLAYILMSENQDGYVILSLKRADRERVWTTLTEKQQSGEPIKVKIATANRGGLLVEFGGVEGFIPISQLSTNHNGKLDSDESNRGGLRSLVGTSIKAKVLTVDKPANKLILSEKAIGDERLEKLAEKVTVGTNLEGTVTGIVDFGLFVKVSVASDQEDMEGLVHISEVSWDRVDDLHSLFEVGQKVAVIVIDNQKGRLSFSIKRLTPDPWGAIEKKYQPGDKVKGQVTRVTPYGAFIKLDGSIDGLVHISELGEAITDPKSVLKEGENYEFRIMSVDAPARKISLSMKDEKKLKGTAEKEVIIGEKAKSKTKVTHPKAKNIKESSINGAPLSTIKKQSKKSVKKA